MVINSNGVLFFRLTYSRGVISFISVFIIATKSRPGAVAWTVLWLKGFMFIMSPSAFTSTVTIRGLSAITTFSYDYV